LTLGKRAALVEAHRARGRKERGTVILHFCVVEGKGRRHLTFRTPGRGQTCRGGERLGRGGRGGPLCTCWGKWNQRHLAFILNSRWGGKKRKKKERSIISTSRSGGEKKKIIVLRVSERKEARRAPGSSFMRGEGNDLAKGRRQTSGKMAKTISLALWIGVKRSCWRSPGRWM